MTLSRLTHAPPPPPPPPLLLPGEKPFECDECDQSFRQKQLLKRHKNLYHTPDYLPRPPREKTHECGECDKAFAHKGNLIRHLATHDPEMQGQFLSSERETLLGWKISFCSTGSSVRSSVSRPCAMFELKLRQICFGIFSDD